MDRIIQTYLDYLLNVKLNNEFIENNNKKNLVESQIQTILKGNPDIISKSVYQQIGGDGGGTLTKEDITKISQLNKLFKEYTSHIKNGATALDINKVRDLLTSLKQKVSESSTTLNQLVLPQYMPQNLETVLSTISNNQSATGFFDQMNELYKFRIPSNSQDPNYQQYKSLLQVLQKTLDEYRKAQLERTKFDATQEKEILENIKKQMTEIERNAGEIDRSIKFYQDKNLSIEKSFKKDIGINDKVFFDPNDPKQTDINETERIYNQLISINPLNSSAIPSPALKLLNDNISNLLKDLKVEGEEFSISRNDVSKIYDAQFVVDEKTGRINIESKYNKDKLGKRLTDEESNKARRDAGLGGGAGILETSVMEFTQQATLFKRKFDEYKIELSKYNFLQIKQIYHTIYSLMVLTNSVYNVSNYTIFKNVGRGTVNFYLRIINNIFDDLENPRKFKDPMVAEIRKKHYITVVKLKYFLEDLNKKFTKSSEKLRISMTNPYVQNMFTLLSHFRRFLEDYSIQGLSKVSIYARINYIKGRKTQSEINSSSKTNDFLNYQNYAMFFSDTERLTTGEGYNFRDLLNSDNLSLSGPTTPEEVAKLEKIKDMIKNKRNLTDRDDRLMWVRRDTCKAGTTDLQKLPPLRAINFTEVFDSTQYAHNEDISRYMNLASRLSTGSGICLITYGYSGTGKTYTLFGKIDEGKEIKGLLQSTLSQLNGLVGVHFRLFELYGYGFSHPDYWKNVDKTARIDNISHKVFEYKLKNSGSEGLDIEGIEEYSADQIKLFIDHIQKVRGHNLDKEFENFYDPVKEKGHDADYNFTENKTEKKIATPDSLKTNLSSQQKVPINPAGQNPQPVDNQGPQKLNYAFIDGKNVEEVFGKFSKFTNEIDKARKTGKGHESTKEEDLIKRIRDTPNNIESSRSVLVYDFVLGIKEEGKIKLVSFLIIDLPGREEIGKTFVSPFETTAIQMALKDGYNKIMEREDNTINSTITAQTITDIKTTITAALLNNKGAQSEKWKKKLLSTERRVKIPPKLENTINNLKIVEIYDNIREIYGSQSVSKLSDQIYSFDIEKAQNPDSYIYDLIQTEGNPDTYIQEIRMLLLCMSLNPLCVPLFAHNIFNKFIKDNKSEIEKIHNIPIKMKFKLLNNDKTSRDDEGEYTIGDEYINSTGRRLSYFFSQDDKGTNPKFFDDPPKEKRGIGYSTVFKNRQIKIIYYIHLMNRLILLNRTDLIKKLYVMIIDHKINKLLKIYIDNFSLSSDIEKFITDLIQDNFKGQFLKEKLIEKEICSFDTSNRATLKSVDITPDLKNIIFEIVKYDYFINGFEGLYINENIMGLIKYLSDKRLTGKDNQNVEEQGEKLNFQNQQRIARLMLMSKEVIPPQDEQQSSHTYDVTIKGLFELRRQFIPILNKKHSELQKFIEIQNDPNKENIQEYKDLKATLLENYKQFINSTKGDYTSQYNLLVNNTDNVETFYKDNIGNINDEIRLNSAKSELKQKSIGFINDVENKLRIQLNDIDKFTKERDYAMAVSNLYQQLHSEFTKSGKITFENGNIAYYLIEYYKNINNNEDINIANIISNTINGLKYETKTNFATGKGDFSNIYKINSTINECNQDIKSTSKTCTSVIWIETKLNEKAISDNKPIKYNTLGTTYSIGELFVYLQNYLYNYYNGTRDLLIKKPDPPEKLTEDQIKILRDKISEKFSVFNIFLQSGTTGWDMADNIRPNIVNNTFSLDEFKKYIEKIYIARTTEVKFLAQLQTELSTYEENVSREYESCKIDSLKNYSEKLNAPLPKKIISTNPVDPTDADSVYTYKQKEVIKLLHEKELLIIERNKLDLGKEGNLLGTTIIDLQIICNQMSNIIGYNVEYNNNNRISIQAITNFNENKFQPRTIEKEIDLERDIYDSIITVDNEPTQPVPEIISTYINSFPFDDVRNRYTEANVNNNNTLKYDMQNPIFVSGKYSLMDQIYLLKHLGNKEESQKLTNALTKGAKDFQTNTANLFNMTLTEYEEFERDCGHLFKAGMRYKTNNINNNNQISLVKGYNYVNNTYSSSKIFCKDYPIIQNILESYLPPQPEKKITVMNENGQNIVKDVPDVDAPLDFSKSYITDFKVFYLFANYDQKNEGLSKLKCKNQYDLLENTLGFIEAIYK